MTTQEGEESEDQTAPGKPSEGGAVPGQQACDGGQSALSGCGGQNSAGSLHMAENHEGTETFHCEDYTCNILYLRILCLLLEFNTDIVLCLSSTLAQNNYTIQYSLIWQFLVPGG